MKPIAQEIDGIRRHWVLTQEDYLACTVTSTTGGSTWLYHKPTGKTLVIPGDYPIGILRKFRAGTVEIIADEYIPVTEKYLPAGYGYWKTNSYPIGGCFRRSAVDVSITALIRGIVPPFKGCDLEVELENGDTAAINSHHLKLLRDKK